MPRQKRKCNKPLIPTFRIFCEGEKTEPYYIRGYISHFHSSERNIIVVEDTKKNTPLQLVDEAISHKANGNKDDIYWVVYDRESVRKYSHERHIKAMDKAKKNNIEIAFSNVCFELWILLHLTCSTAGYESCGNLIDKSKLKELLKEKGLKDYDKGFAYLFDILKDDVEVAIENAETIKKNALDTAENGKESPCYLNPYTDVHELFLDIDNFLLKKESVRAER